MGGFGSGTWDRWQGRKSTVEESLTLAVRDFRGRLFQGAQGQHYWTLDHRMLAWIDWSVTWEWSIGAGQKLPVLILKYVLNGRETVETDVWLESTPTTFGGPRWWFSCPQLGCGQRCGKLFLPPDGETFGCRACHDLTYRSSQRAHQAERVRARIRRLYRARGAGLEGLDEIRATRWKRRGRS